MFRSRPVNHTLGSSCGATTVHYEERVGERHLVVITVTFETDSDVGSGDVDVDVDDDDDEDVEAYLFKSELRKISVWISTKLKKVFEEGRVADATQIDLYYRWNDHDDE